MQTPDITAALIAGLASFLSPCILPLLPAYISTLAGTPLQGAGWSTEARSNLRKNALAFTLGLGVIFIGLGLAAGLLGRYITTYQDILSRIGGVLVIVLGLNLIGVLKVGLLNRDFGFDLDTGEGSGIGVWQSLVLGGVFALGWTPCVGPILTSILILAGTQDSAVQGGMLLAVYAAGMAIPFLLAAWVGEQLLSRLRNLNKWTSLIQRGAGVILILLGLLLVSGRFELIANFFS